MTNFTHIEINYFNEDRYSISWRNEKARFHMWGDAVLYKNPLPITLADGTERNRNRRDAGYFNTRQLEPTAAVNRYMIEWVMQAVNEGDMITAAKEAYLASEKIKADGIALRNARTKQGLQIVRDLRDAAAHNVLVTLDRDAISALLSLIPNNEEINQ